MKPVKYAVAFVLYNSDRSACIMVRRPPDDADLPDVWGLPAGSLKERESFGEAVMRSARDKLGLEVRVTTLIREGEIEREQCTLHMKEFEAEIEAGIPTVPQAVAGITQYVAWKWGTPDELVAAAQKGSLCSRLYLESLGRTW